MPAEQHFLLCEEEEALPWVQPFGVILQHVHFKPLSPILLVSVIYTIIYCINLIKWYHQRAKSSSAVLLSHKMSSARLPFCRGLCPWLCSGHAARPLLVRKHSQEAQQRAGVGQRQPQSRPGVVTLDPLAPFPLWNLITSIFRAVLGEGGDGVAGPCLAELQSICTPSTTRAPVSVAIWCSCSAVEQGTCRLFLLPQAWQVSHHPHSTISWTHSAQNPLGPCI